MVAARIAMALALGVAGLGAAPAPAAAGLTLDRVVVVMRHGVRPPTKAQPLPVSVTPERWPDWPVAPGWLTQHGAEAVKALGHADRSGWARAGLVPAKGCPADSIAIVADSDQRTIATADAWIAGFAPGCAIAVDHRPQGEPDPRFGGIGGGTVAFDPAAANAEVARAAGPGGAAGLDRSYASLLARLDRILCGPHTEGCGVRQVPTKLTPATATERPKLGGALDRASTAAQSLLLEYVEGKPANDVGWGRATGADITALSAFHALEFRLLARPLPVARANLAPIVAKIRQTLTAESAPRVTLFSGHDTRLPTWAACSACTGRSPAMRRTTPPPAAPS